MKNKIENLISGILESYKSIGGINHLEGPNLPSRQSIIRIVDDLESLIFPGFRDEENLDSMNYPYLLASKITHVAQNLTLELEKSLRYMEKGDNPADRAREIVLNLLEKFTGIRKTIKKELFLHIIS